MWYFSWILGTGLALSFAVLNAIWYEILEQPLEGSQNAAVIPPVADAPREK
jgi:cyd operon protein YbgT